MPALVTVILQKYCGVAIPQSKTLRVFDSSLYTKEPLSLRSFDKVKRRAILARLFIYVFN
jgi:hypothetical protein